MSSAPTQPVDVPPYQLQSLLTNVLDGTTRTAGPPLEVRCAQALGSDIYIGCSNGELLRFSLQINNPNSPEPYSLSSRQNVSHGRPIESIALVPSISRALVLADRQIHFYTIPALDPIPPQVMKPIRNVVTFAVDEQHIQRPPLGPSENLQQAEPVEFCVIKRSAVALYSLRERLQYQKEIPLPQTAVLARRSGKYLCMADKEMYSVVDLNAASLIPLLPVSQAFNTPDIVVKPSITVINDREFLILSWNGENTMGVFITGDAEPVRGTLEWPSHPEAVCLDYPYITTLLPNDTIEIHSIETLTMVQVVSAPPTSPTPSTPIPSDRKTLAWSAGGVMVPSSQRSSKLRSVSVPLLRT